MSNPFDQIVGLSDSELNSLPIIADVQFAEKMGSTSFNRKLLGVASAGIYRGFNFAIAGVNTIKICPEPLNTAVVERQNVCLTVQGQHPIDLIVPYEVHSAVVIEANAQYGVLTSQVDKNSTVKAVECKIVPFDSVMSHHVIVCTVFLPNGENLALTHISVEHRTIGGLMNRPTFEQANSLYAKLNDSRLSNAREWSASQVSQAEAEAGTATTDRKWTAERVRQAIASYVNPKVKSLEDRVKTTFVYNPTNHTSLGKAQKEIVVFDQGQSATVTLDAAKLIVGDVIEVQKLARPGRIDIVGTVNIVLPNGVSEPNHWLPAGKTGVMIFECVAANQLRYAGGF